MSGIISRIRTNSEANLNYLIPYFRIELVLISHNTEFWIYVCHNLFSLELFDDSAMNTVFFFKLICEIPLCSTDIFFFRALKINTVVLLKRISQLRRCTPLCVFGVLKKLCQISIRLMDPTHVYYFGSS